MEQDKILKIGEKRSFLNLPYMTSVSSMIGYSIHMYSYHYDKTDPKWDKVKDHEKISFTISDCNSQINLDFSIETEDEMRNSLHKLDTIISTCQSMKKDLKKARSVYLNSVKIRKELEKEESK
jgi:hypothetical protein